MNSIRSKFGASVSGLAPASARHGWDRSASTPFSSNAEGFENKNDPAKSKAAAAKEWAARYKDLEPPGGTAGRGETSTPLGGGTPLIRKPKGGKKKPLSRSGEPTSAWAQHLWVAWQGWTAALHGGRGGSAGQQTGSHLGASQDIHPGSSSTSVGSTNVDHTTTPVLPPPGPNNEPTWLQHVYRGTVIGMLHSYYLTNSVSFTGWATSSISSPTTLSISSSSKEASHIEAGPDEGSKSSAKGAQDLNFNAQPLEAATSRHNALKLTVAGASMTTATMDLNN
eukprot:gene16448-22667_t